MYQTNEQTNEISFFGQLQPGWRPATQEEIDEYLLDDAKQRKIVEISERCDVFCFAGYEYKGEIYCSDWSPAETYACKALVLGSDSKNYKSLQKNNTDNDPISSPEWWVEFYPVFKTNDKTTANIILKNGLPLATPDRYKFSDKDKITVNFDNATHWAAFFDEILPEKDRIMRKYEDYYEQIDLCEKIAEVDAIVINFAA